MSECQNVPRKLDLSFSNSFNHIKNLWLDDKIVHEKFPTTYNEVVNDSERITINGAKHSSHEVEEVVNPLDADIALQNISFDFNSLEDSLYPSYSRHRSIKPPKHIQQSPELAIYRKTFVHRPVIGLEMCRIIGNYQHQRNENLDGYFKAIGVPYIARKMMGMTSPRLEIVQSEDKWIIRLITMLRTLETKFTLNEEYEEILPSGDVLKNITSMEGDALVTVSTLPNKDNISRKYELANDEIVLTMTHEKSGQVAKRYFKRIR